jgi:hypothetical protein
MASRLAAALLALLVWLAAAPASAVDLTGTWYVLVHFTDETTGKPDQMRWEDRLWIFEPKGAQLQWTEYPIVVFTDESGRFERLGSNRQSRVLGAWEPNPAQLAEIQGGLQYNTRGGKQKSLEGSSSTGWSSGTARRSQSASVISYSETWTIDSPSGLPVFTREDVMGSSDDDVAEGRTIYKSEAVEGDAVLKGSFERDGTRRGTFKMVRSGAASITRGSGKTQEERMRDAFIANMGGELFSEAEIERFRAMERESGGKGGDRSSLRAQVREEVEREFRERGENPRSTENVALVDKITNAVVSALEQGASPEELRRRVLGEIQVR